MKRKVYLDSGSTTYVSNEVVAEMLPIFSTVFGNSNSLHSFGRDAAAMVDRARDRLAKVINAKNNEIYWTSSGTESNNLAILGIAKANKHKGNHIIVSAIEHESVLKSCELLQRQGFKVTYLKCDSSGIVKVSELIRYITKQTILVSVMAVNNEVGTIQNIKTIAKIAHENNAIFHTDACQALGEIAIDVVDMEIDAMSVSAHKIYGPKGVGALYVNNDIDFEAQIFGGNQERYKRGGTLNTASIVGFGKACEIANRDSAAINHKMKVLREYFVRNVCQKIDGVILNGHMSQKINKVVSISFHNCESESLTTLLDLQGIAVSFGSACNAGSVKQSHVIKAMTSDDEVINSAIRFSFSKNTTIEDLDYAIEVLENCVERLRGMSPNKTRREA